MSCNSLSRFVRAEALICLGLISSLSACSSPGEELDPAQVSESLTWCGSGAAPQKSGTASLAELTEASGLVQSVRNPGVLYTHNDSGNLPRVYAIAENGTHLATLTLQGSANLDWEDIAVGPGPTTGTTYIYLGDIGDNAMNRKDIVIERFAEPAVSTADRARMLQTSHESLHLSYPDGPHNAETLLVDPLSGELYLVTKGDRGGSRVYVARPPLSASGSNRLDYVTSLAFGSGVLSGSTLATGGDVRADGSAVVLRTYDSAFLWPRAPGTLLASVFSAQPCAVPMAREPQGEAIAFSADGKRYFTISEGAKQTLYRGALE